MDSTLLRIMKIITTLLLAAMTSMASAQADVEFAKFGYLEPRIHLKRLLEIAGEISGRQVIVTHEEDLKRTTSLVLPPPVSKATVQKVISALLLLEGFELVDEKDELHLRKVLTPEQRKALNDGLARPEAEPVEPARERLPRGAQVKARKPWVVIRPEGGGEPKPAK